MASKGKLSSFVKGRPSTGESGRDGHAFASPFDQPQAQSIWDNVTDDFSELVATPVPSVHERDAGQLEPAVPRPSYPVSAQRLAEKIGGFQSGPERSHSHRNDLPLRSASRNEVRPRNVNLYSNVTSATLDHPDGGGRDYRDVASRRSRSRDGGAHSGQHYHQPETAVASGQRYSSNYKHMPSSPSEAQISQWKAVINQGLSQPAQPAQPAQFRDDHSRPADSRIQGLNDTVPTVAPFDRPASAIPIGRDSRDFSGERRQAVAGQAPRDRESYKALYFDLPDTVPIPAPTVVEERVREVKTSGDGRRPPAEEKDVAGPPEPKNKAGAEEEPAGKGAQLDYDPNVLKAMPYSALRDLAFDDDPATVGKGKGHAVGRGVTAALPGAGSAPLSERLSAILYAPAGQQAQFLESLNISEWEDVGELVVKQMGGVMSRLVDLRKEKRRLFAELEDEIYARHELVEAKVERIDEALSGMRRNGSAILRESISPGK